MPYFVTPSGNLVTCEVVGDIPHLRVGAEHCQPSEPTRTVHIPAMPASAGPCDDDDNEDVEGEEVDDADGDDLLDDAGEFGDEDEGYGPEHFPSDDDAVELGGEVAEVVPVDAEAPGGDDSPHAVGPRKDLRMEARSASHLLLHRPFHPYCKSYVAGKMKKKSSKQGDFQRVTTFWGELVTSDHIDSKSDENKGMFGEKEAYTIKDVYCTPALFTPTRYLRRIRRT